MAAQTLHHRRQHATPPRGLRAGFTLLEVMLAVFLVVFMAGASFGFYQYMGAIRGDTVARLDRLRRQRLVMDMLSADLTAAFILDESVQASLTMNDTMLEIATTVAQTGSAWFDGGVGDVPPAPGFDVRLVRYQLAEDTGEDGEVVNAGLLRSEDRLIFTTDADSAAAAAATDNADDQPSARVNVQEIRFLRFRYYESVATAQAMLSAGITDEGWRGSWHSPTLPSAVEITMGFEPLAEGQSVEDYLEREVFFRRVVYLPGSAVATLGQ